MKNSEVYCSHYLLEDHQADNPTFHHVQYGYTPTGPMRNLEHIKRNHEGSKYHQILSSGQLLEHPAARIDQLRQTRSWYLKKAYESNPGTRITLMSFIKGTY